MVDNNIYWERVCVLADKQRQKGIAVYGRGLEDYKTNSLVKIENIEEELIDALMYLEWLKDKQTEVASAVDWDNVEVDTLVYINSERADFDNTPRYFAFFENGKVHCFSGGKTSVTESGTTEWLPSEVSLHEV